MHSSPAAAQVFVVPYNALVGCALVARYWYEMVGCEVIFCSCECE